VRDQNDRQSRPGRRQRVIERREMLGMADARIDQAGGTLRTDNQVRIVTSAGHRTGIVGIQDDRNKHDTQVWSLKSKVCQTPDFTPETFRSCTELSARRENSGCTGRGSRRSPRLSPQLSSSHANADLALASTRLSHRRCDHSDELLLPRPRFEWDRSCTRRGPQWRDSDRDRERRSETTSIASPLRPHSHRPIPIHRFAVRSARRTAGIRQLTPLTR